MATQEKAIEQTSQEQILHAEFNDIAIEISSKLDAERQGNREPWDHSHYNWASEIHHPCKKFLVHCRIDWRERQIMDIDGEWRVEEGNDKEWKAKKMLGDIGFELKESQRKYTTDDSGLKRFNNLKISGRIDGLLPLNRKLPEPFDSFQEIPAEVKSISPHYWQSTKTIEDLKRHPKFWINKIPSQLNTYCMFKDWPGGLLILITFGKKPRILSMLFDEELWEEDKRRVIEVNKHVKANAYPAPIPFDATVCGMCDFNHICQPLKSTNIIELQDIDEIELEMYLELKDQHKQYEAMKKELIGDMKKPGKYFGKEAFINDIEIKTKKSIRKKYPEMPKEIKEPYEVEYELIQTSIERIEK